MQLAVIDKSRVGDGLKLVNLPQGMARKLRQLMVANKARLEDSMQSKDELKIYFEPRKALAWQVFASDGDENRANHYAQQLRSMFAHLGSERFSAMKTSFEWIFFFSERKDLAMALLVSELPVTRMYDRQLDSLTK